MKKSFSIPFETKELLILGPFAANLPLEHKQLPCLAIDGSPATHLQQNDVLRIGDGDSGPAEQMDILLSQNKDASDLSYALGHIPSWIKIVHMAGFKGGRIDHELANYGEVIHQLKQISTAYFIFYDETSTPYAYLFKAGHYQFFSQGLFSLALFESTNVKITGNCDYLWDGTFKPYSSLGLSNYARGEFNLKSQAPFILFNHSQLEVRTSAGHT